MKILATLPGMRSHVTVEDVERFESQRSLWQAIFAGRGTESLEQMAAERLRHVLKGDRDGR